MSVKRTIAKAKIRQRKWKRGRVEKEARRLGLARNKALKEAERASKLAKAREDERQAVLKKERAMERLEGVKRTLVQRRARAGRNRGARTSVKRTTKTLSSIYKGVGKFFTWK